MTTTPSTPISAGPEDPSSGESGSDAAAIAEASRSAAVADDVAYLDQVMVEIDAEVRRRRASGDLPASLERELDELFLEFSPVGLQGKAKMRETLALIDSSAYVDIAVPTASNKAIGVYIKKTIRKMIGWYMRFIADQIIKMFWATSRMSHVLVEHVEDLEADVEAHRTPDLPVDVVVPADLAAAWWAPKAASALSAVGGRVAVGECGTGSLVEALVASGVDAYGLDPSDLALEDAIDRGADLRAESVLDHLGVVADEALAGVVLTGAVERLRPNERGQLMELVATKVAVGGTVVLHSTTPEAWARSAPPLVRDLAPGRPLHAATWAHLLGGRGFAVTETTTGGAGGALAHVATSSPDAGAVNAAIDAVNELLGGPAEYVLVAVRER